MFLRLFNGPSQFFSKILICSVFCLDKLDEILAAAQHTITSDSQGQRGHVGRRDRSKSIVPNVSSEVHWECGLTKTLTNTKLSWACLPAIPFGCTNRLQTNVSSFWIFMALSNTSNKSTYKPKHLIRCESGFVHLCTVCWLHNTSIL